jgi:(S)-2-hydroxyglutarate dehydrogenase
VAQNQFDIVVIGAGIVGLSTAMHLTRSFPGLRLAVLEKEAGVARHQSGHNSGVIHSGIYYKPGSLKARLCVEGAAAMVAFCRQHNLPHEVCGKVIVATNERESQALPVLLERGIANGLEALKLLDRAQLLEIEPHCAGIRGLHVPMTGITDYALVSEKYADLIREQGGSLLTDAEVLRFTKRSNETVIHTSRGDLTAQ